MSWKHGVIFLIALLALAAGRHRLVAQDVEHPAVGASSISQAPPDFAKLIHLLSGHWSLQLSYPEGQISQESTGSGTEFWHLGPGGNSFVEEYRSTGKEGVIAGLGIIWRDEEAGRFRVLWCDSTDTTGCTTMTNGARWEGEAVVISHEWEEAGNRKILKEVFSNFTENSFTQTLYQGESGANLKVLVEIHATREQMPSAIPDGAAAFEPLGHSIEASKSISAPALRGHMRFLSDSLLEGRATGSRGHEVATLYVAAQLEAMGLEPAGDNGTYFQNVRLRRAVNDGVRSSLSLVREGQKIPLKYAEDYLILANLDETNTSIEAPIVFAGYGVTAPELGYDDYAGIDVRGKIVAVFGNAPARFASTERAYYADEITKLKNAASHGAVGILGLSLPEDESDSPWRWVVPQIQAGGRDWLDKGIPHHSFPDIRVTALLNVSATALVFSRAPKTLEQAITAAKASQPQAFPLAWNAKARSASSHQIIESRNVAGKIQGSDPKLKEQYLIYSAHLDHLGKCAPVDGASDTVCHGTMDNASGVAAVLEIARAFSKLPKPPRRSVIFLFPTGEEGNLEGSDYFAHFPTVPGKDMIADINLDVAPGMRYPCSDLNAIGAEHSSLMRNAEWAAALSGYKITADPMPEQNFFVRSDQYSFAQQGVPSVLIRNGSDGTEVIKNWLQTRYHTPLDNMEQPVDYQAGAKAAGAVFLMGYQIVQQDQVPEWNPGDFIGTKFNAKHSQ